MSFIEGSLIVIFGKLRIIDERSVEDKDIWIYSYVYKLGDLVLGDVVWLVCS